MKFFQLLFFCAYVSNPPDHPAKTDFKWIPSITRVKVKSKSSNQLILRLKLTH